MQIHISRGILHFIDLSKQMYKVDRLANVAAYDMPTGSKEAFWKPSGPGDILLEDRAFDLVLIWHSS